MDSICPSAFATLHPKNMKTDMKTESEIPALVTVPTAPQSLNQLVNPAPSENLALAQVSRSHFISVAVAATAQPSTDIAVSNVQSLPAPKHRRRGRVALLPKIHRDMVNRMIENGVP